MSALISPVAGLFHLWSQPYVRDGLIAGAALGVASGLVSYFLVLRSQVFAGDALSHVAFAGALAALAAGVDLRVGLYTGCIVFAVALGGLGRRARPDDVVIGNLFAWVLGLGALFLTLYTTDRSGQNGTGGVNVLFGSLFAISTGDTFEIVAISSAVVAAVLLVARPLLFASLDEAVARSRGVATGLLGYGFLIALGVTVGAATQAVGALVALGLLAAPAGTALRLTKRPYRAMGISVAVSLASVVGGVVLAYEVPSLPPSFAVMAVATGVLLASSLLTSPFVKARRSRRRSRRHAGAGAAVASVARASE